MSQSIILVHYEINKDEITAKYCVNKDKPQMHCCGKCLLKKKLAEQQEQQKLPAFPDIKTDISIVHKAYKVHEVCKVVRCTIYRVNKLSTQCSGTGVFHPPSC